MDGKLSDHMPNWRCPILHVTLRKRSCSGVTTVLVSNGLKTYCRYEFSLIFFNSFYNVFYYSNEMCVPICERLPPVVPELQHSFFKLFFNLFYYSYKMHLPIFKRMR